MYIGQFPMYIGQFLCKLVRFLCKLTSYLIANTFSADDLYRKSFRMRNKKAHAGRKNEAGGPEKQVILFVWPYMYVSKLVDYMTLIVMHILLLYANLGSLLLSHHCLVPNSAQRMLIP